jgi:glycosyltransferase involved in cell wall biosynthesis
MSRECKKKICVILPWSINNDSRAQRTSLTLSLHFHVDIICISDFENEKKPNLIKNISVKRIKNFKRSIWDRFYLPFHTTSNCLKSNLQKSLENYDILYCHDLPALLAVCKTSITRQKIVYDIHDLYIETVNQGLQKNLPFSFLQFKSIITTFTFRFFIKRIEKKYIKQANLIFSVNSSISNYIESKYHLECDTIENFPTSQPIPSLKKLRDFLEIPPSLKIVIYHGNLGGGRYLPEIINSAFFFNDNIRLVVIGDGELKDKLISKANTNTFFLDQVPYENLFQFTSDANLGIVLLEHINYSKKHASANKLFEYMACGIPVAISNSPELIKVVQKEGNGIIIKEINSINIANFINDFFENSLRESSMGSKGRLAFENRYNWTTQEKKLIELFTQKI